MSNTGTTINTSGGVSFLGLLALLFIGLNLGSLLSWPWWWVLAPLWAPVLLSLAAKKLPVIEARLRKGSGRVV